MSWIIENLDVAFFVTLFAFGYFAGRINEGRHFASLRQREKTLAGVLIFSNRFPPVTAAQLDTRLVSGSVVISDDYGKDVMSGLYSLFGVRVRSYESLIERARREAVLRMKREALRHGARMIINVKFQTFAIGGRNANNIRGVELLAYGTSLAAPR